MVNFFYHFNELFYKFKFYLFSLFTTFLICLYYSEQIVFYLTKSLSARNTIDYLIYTDVTEVFFSYLEISIFYSLNYSIPLLLLYLWLYYRPAMYISESSKIAIIILFSIIIYFFSYFFIFYIILPYSFNFFFSFQVDGLMSIYLEPKVSEIVDYILSIYMYFCFSMQFPIIIIIISELGIINRYRLVKYRSLVLVAIFFIASIITPPDLFTLVIVSIPLILFYEVSIFFLFVFSSYSKL